MAGNRHLSRCKRADRRFRKVNSVDECIGYRDAAEAAVGRPQSVAPESKVIRIHSSPLIDCHLRFKPAWLLFFRFSTWKLEICWSEESFCGFARD